MIIFSRIGLLFLIFFGILFLCVPHDVSAAEPNKIMVYFYSAESNINNFRSLKMEWDAYLSGFGPYEFQPFRDKNDFETHIRDKKKCLVLMSSWHYSHIREDYSLSPALVGTRKGDKYQKRILVGKGDTVKMENVKNGRIASASSMGHTRSILRDMMGNDADAANILAVPKDIDALMSVGFGMSQYALAAESALEKLNALNPLLHKNIKVIAEGSKSLMLILAFPKNFTGDGEKVIRVIQDMPANADGKKKMRMFGLDGWQLLDSSDKLKLEG